METHLLNCLTNKILCQTDKGIYKCFRKTYSYFDFYAIPKQKQFILITTSITKLTAIQKNIASDLQSNL